MTDNGDPIDRAIADAGQVRMSAIQGTMPTGRPFAVNVPSDLTWQEACALAGMVVQLPGQLAARRGPQLVIPTPVLRRQ